MYCKHCGIETDEKNKYCTNCGGKINSDGDEMNNKIGEVKEKAKSTLQNFKSKVENGEINKKYLALALCIAICLIILPIASMRNNPERVVRNYFEYSEKGEFEKAYKLINIPDELQENIKEEIEEMKEYYTNEEDMARLLSVKTLVKEKKTAVVSVTIQEDTYIDTGNLALVKVNGKWKLDSELTKLYNK